MLGLTQNIGLCAMQISHVICHGSLDMEIKCNLPLALVHNRDFHELLALQKRVLYSLLK